jgi:hypothetical protein
VEEATIQGRGAELARRVKIERELARWPRPLDDSTCATTAVDIVAAVAVAAIPGAPLSAMS